MRQRENEGTIEDRVEFGTGLRARVERAREKARDLRSSLGAVVGADYVVAPALHLVQAPALVAVSHEPGDEELEGDAFALLLDLMRTVDGRENLDLDHSRSIARLARRLSRTLGLDEDAARRAYLAGLFHDLGKIELPETLLRKPGPLDEREWVEMASHAERGAELVDRIGGLSDVAWIVAAHHERWDGVGYPRKIGGEAIPAEARVVAASDAFVTMTSHRPFRGALTTPAALTELIRNAGTSFDPSVVSALLALTVEEAQRGDPGLELELPQAAAQ